jgi:antitoxin (DNA-binding transcriptional repressor) of toxin-antitoxin stability system
LPYDATLRSVNIGELRDHLSAYLQYARNGEEIVVRDRNVPVARIVPFVATSISEEDAALVASGDMKLPEKEMDWEAFWARPKANVPLDVAVEALIDSRGDR